MVKDFFSKYKYCLKSVINKCILGNNFDLNVVGKCLRRTLAIFFNYKKQLKLSNRQHKGQTSLMNEYQQAHVAQPQRWPCGELKCDICCIAMQAVGGRAGLTEVARPSTCARSRSLAVRYGLSEMVGSQWHGGGERD